MNKGIKEILLFVFRNSIRDLGLRTQWNQKFYKASGK